MGWTYTHKTPGTSVKAFFEDRFNYDNDNYALTVIDCAAYLNVAYLAIEQIKKATNDREVFAVVCLIHYQHNSYYNFGYKDMEESMGPIKSNCPERILKLLTPTNHEWAKEWRKRCWANLQKKKSLPRLKKDMIIEFETPIEFVGGSKGTIFKVMDPQKRIFARWLEMHGIGVFSEPRYKISRSRMSYGDWRAIDDPTTKTVNVGS